MEKKRIDVLIVEKGLVESREKAKALIMAGKIIVNDKRIDKAGEKVKVDSNIRIKGEGIKYVSRGGYKLEKALQIFNIDAQSKTILDIGASTGGFTDCILQNGAKFVYSVDVGTNQLHWKLRADNQVKSIENMHIKDLTLDDIDNSKVDIIVIDVSFISLTYVFKYLKEFLKNDGKIIALIKPQFEVGKDKISKGGIVKEERYRKEAIEKVRIKAEELGFYLLGVDNSPITGTKGNIEFVSAFKMKTAHE